MKKNYFFVKIFNNQHTAKANFAVILLLNILSSFFHLYYSSEPISKGGIYSEGNVVVYNSTDSEKSNTISSNSCNSPLIHLEGDALLYEQSNHQDGGISEKAKSKKIEKKVTNENKFNKKEFNNKKSNANINALGNTSDILLGYYKSNNIAVQVNNSYPKLAFKNNLPLKVTLLNSWESKSDHITVSRKKLFSHIKKYFGRPPPFLV